MVRITNILFIIIRYKKNKKKNTKYDFKIKADILRNRILCTAAWI